MVAAVVCPTWRDITQAVGYHQIDLEKAFYNYIYYFLAYDVDPCELVIGSSKPKAIWRGAIRKRTHHAILYYSLNLVCA
jgi:hypothetical protein